MPTLGVVVLADVLAVVAVMTACAAWARRVHRFGVVDVGWGLAFVTAALAGGVAGELSVGSDGDPIRRWLVTAMVVVWGARLSRHLLGRVRNAERDDPRYEEMLGGRFDEVPFPRVAGKVFGLQALLVVVVSAPVVLGQSTPTAAWPMAVLGVAVWSLGLVFEAVGDAQLRAYREDPDRGRVLDTGLWAWTRHPNYFGDCCVWWGIWLVGGVAGGWTSAAASLPAPVIMTVLLTRVSGARLAERRMRGRPGWDEYAARTPMFLPRPPRRADPG